MRLGFVTPSLMFRDDGVWTNAGLGRLIEALSSKVDRLSVAASFAPDRQDPHEYRLPKALADRAQFLPSMPTIAKGLRDGRSCERVIRDIEGHADAVIVQLPFSAPTALLTSRRPRVYHVCADVQGVVAASPFYTGARRVAARAAAFGIDVLQRVMFDQPETRVVTNGDALRAHYGFPPGRSVVSSTLHASEVGSKTRQRDSARFRVLFVGYLRPEKGIDVLLDAFEALIAEDTNAELVIVGGIDSVETAAAKTTKERLRALTASGNAHVVGPVPFGPLLFQQFADADVLVLPSRSEGTPRVLIEARAFGCPVIASNVGGIPTSVDDGRDGLLVEPGDARALLAAIKRLRSDDVLRATLIERGYERARRTTIDAQADALVAEASSLLSSR